MKTRKNNHPLRILAISPTQATEVSLGSLTAIGGKKSTGIVIGGLKHEGDYAVLALGAQSLSIHPLRGGKNRAVSLENGQTFQIDDLTFYAENAQTTVSASETTGDDRMSTLLASLAVSASTEKPLSDILKAALEISGHDHGLIATENLEGKFEILTSLNIDSSETWLSESIIQHAISEKKPVVLQNVFGSDFDTKKSIIATKFMSVFCFPLVVQGKTKGVLVSASRRPYAESFEKIRTRFESTVHLAALVLDFRLRELVLNRELETARGNSSKPPFLSDSPAITEVCGLAQKVAPSDLSVLIQGETGVGKEVLSRWIHQNSDRKSAPLITVNCAAIPAELLESVLFGHKRGAFTGAVADHVGKIQQADGGTLFLDEIGDLSLPLQAKLLRVIQDGVVEPVGSQKSVTVNVRLICASHKNIRNLSLAKQFRDDLYYRIAQITLTIPPLRERPSDIRLLARTFLAEFGSSKEISSSAWNYLLSQSWPGNIRELKSAIQRAVVLSTGNEIQPKDLTAGSGETKPSSAGLSSAGDLPWLGGADLESAKQAFVIQKITQALDVTEGNRTRAAELLGVTPRTLFRYLEQRPMTELSQ